MAEVAHSRKQSVEHKAFKDQLSKESLEVFNEAAKRPFSEQCVFFLNAFWAEYGDQAEWIYSVANKIFRMADMNAKGVKYAHKYEEGDDLDFDMGLYFFEQLCLFAEEPTHNKFRPYGLNDWFLKNKDYKDTYGKSIPEMMSSLPRKKELRDKVDVNFDGRVSMLEYLLYQYKASPKDLMDRSMGTAEEHPAITKARKALAEVRKRVREYEAEKARLKALEEKGGVKGLTAKNELAQIESSPLWEAINKALITAEAAVRIASRKFGGGKVVLDESKDNGQGGVIRTDGRIWWMNRELEEQQEKYGRKKK
mmetsp:Transcript_40770/g.86929  ORF Transcript_40770/g.86929 Transcript_40770/m.86929 type:complete len:309 (-) Transcript_40770:146-1072(-)